MENVIRALRGHQEAGYRTRNSPASWLRSTVLYGTAMGITVCGDAHAAMTSSMNGLLNDYTHEVGADLHHADQPRASSSFSLMHSSKGP